jgi:hypothetical protein
VSVTLQEIVVVDPSAETLDGDTDPGPDAGPLRGKTVGLRVDVLWRSWDWVVDEWRASLAAAGAETVVWRRDQGLVGEPGEAQEAEYARFLSQINVAIVGLGNCGSCTSWTIKDAIGPLAAGIPTVGVVTEQFVALASTLAAHYGKPGLRLQQLPYPFDLLPELDVRQIARDRFPEVLATLGAEV